MRKCKVCGIEKELSEFYKNHNYYMRTCRDCHNSKFRTGKENIGRFKKGIIPNTAWKIGNKPWNKGIKTGLTPWNKGIPLTEEVKNKLSNSLKGRIISEETREKLREIARNKGWDGSRRGKRGEKWANEVKLRDNWTCVKCGENNREKIIAHHKIRWQDDESLRLDINNGETLCISCHNKHHHKGRIPWNKIKV
jgi:5-methylcytosine-specific restriction endonuclease McrA